MLSNIDIRIAAKAAGVPLWKIAKELGVSDMTLFRRLRKELSPEQKQQYFDAIQQIVRERALSDLYC